MIVLRLPRKAGSHFILRLPEFLLAICLFGLGAQLARSGHSFGVSHIYDVLDRMAPERVWALSAMIVATVRLIALLLNGFFPVIRRVTPGLRSITAFAGGCIWAALTIGFVIENNLIVGIVAHMGLTVFDFSYAIMIAGEAARHEKRARYAAGK